MVYKMSVKQMNYSNREQGETDCSKNARTIVISRTFKSNDADNVYSGRRVLPNQNQPQRIVPSKKKNTSTHILFVSVVRMRHTKTYPY